MISMVRTPCDSFYSSYRVESYHVHDRKFVHCVHSYWSLIYYTHILYISKLKASKNVKTSITPLSADQGCPPDYPLQHDLSGASVHIREGEALPPFCLR